MFSRAKAGRRRARECFQIAPSLEKIELPRRGMKVARRACVHVSLGFGMVVHGVVLFFFKRWTYRSYLEFLGNKGQLLYFAGILI